MHTNYNIGDTVYFEAKVEEINIDCNGIIYKISFKDCFGHTSVLCVREDQLNAEA